MYDQLPPLPLPRPPQNPVRRFAGQVGRGLLIGAGVLGAAGALGALVNPNFPSVSPLTDHPDTNDHQVANEVSNTPGQRFLNQKVEDYVNTNFAYSAGPATHLIRERADKHTPEIKYNDKGKVIAGDRYKGYRGIGIDPVTNQAHVYQLSSPDLAGGIPSGRPVDVPHGAHVQEYVWGVNDPEVAEQLEKKALATQGYTEKSLKQDRWKFKTAFEEADEAGSIGRLPIAEAISRRYPS